MITVEDNGIGLDEKNFEAFLTTDTDNKISIGGKGVGRLLWLDCFSKISVFSVYREGKALRSRAFRFVLTRDHQIQEYAENVTKEHADTMFTVTFDGLRDNGYKSRFPWPAVLCISEF